MARTITAEFTTEGMLDEAARNVRARGLGDIEAYGPYPLEGIAALQGRRTWIVPVITTLAVLAGGVGTYWLQYWMNGIDYPLNVGGRPLASWPAFVPATLIVGVLSGGAASLLGMLVLCGLPRLDHPAFETPGFERASQDRFFLSVTVEGGDSDIAELKQLLADARANALHEVLS
jgi:hypothetical protein